MTAEALSKYEIRKQDSNKHAFTQQGHKIITATLDNNGCRIVTDRNF